MTRFIHEDIWIYFPSEENASREDAEVFKDDTLLFFILAACFAALVALDNWLFLYHPFKFNLVIDLEDKRDKDKTILRKLTADNTEQVSIFKQTP